MPLGLNRKEAASLIGVAEGTFDGMIAAGVMPEPRIHGDRLLWSRIEIEEAFHKLPRRGETPPESGRSRLDEILGT